MASCNSKRKVKKMMGGGMTAPSMTAPSMPGMAGAQVMDPKMAMAMEAQRKQAAMGGMKKGGKVKKMMGGGKVETKGMGLILEDRDTYKRGAKRDLPAAKKMLEETPKRPTKDATYKSKKMKSGGMVKKMKAGGKVTSCSKRADGIITKGHTRGRMV